MSYYIQKIGENLHIFKVSEIDDHKSVRIVIFPPRSVSDVFELLKIDIRTLTDFSTYLLSQKCLLFLAKTTWFNCVSNYQSCLLSTRLWHCGSRTNCRGRKAGWWWTRPRTGERRERSTSVLTILRWKWILVLTILRRGWILKIEVVKSEESPMMNMIHSLIFVVYIVALTTK